MDIYLRCNTEILIECINYNTQQKNYTNEEATIFNGIYAATTNGKCTNSRRD